MTLRPAEAPRPEIYVSTDVETDGPIPGENSMLSMASVAFDEGGRELAAFSVNLETLPGAKANAKTMEWWQGQPAAWAAARKDAVPAKQAMDRYMIWLERLQGEPVFVGYPLLFDMMFVYWYLMKFAGRSPFSHSGIDIKTMAYTALGGESYRNATKKHMPRGWFPPNMPHTHVALDDAREQGLLFFNIRNVLRTHVPKIEFAKRPPTRERR
jgi:hypothetical protein